MADLNFIEGCIQGGLFVRPNCICLSLPTVYTYVPQSSLVY